MNKPISKSLSRLKRIRHCGFESGFLDQLADSAIRFGDFYARIASILLPNKTDAVQYLDGNGPVPGRYAQVSVLWDCYSREYMAGPLPINNLTSKLIPLDYLYNGNSTLEFSECADADVPGYGGLDSPYDEVQGWTGKELPGEDKAAPITILPDGPRHKFDPDQNYISWSKFLQTTNLLERCADGEKWTFLSSLQ